MSDDRKKPPKGHRLTWRRVPRKTGRAGIVQGERGYELWVNVGDRDPVRVGNVSVCFQDLSKVPRGYYIWCGAAEQLGIRHINTSAHPNPHTPEGLEGAKRALWNHIAGCLQAHVVQQKGLEG